MNRPPFNRRSMLRLSAAGGAIDGAVSALPLILLGGSAAPVSPHADHASPPLHIREGNLLDTSHAGHTLCTIAGEPALTRATCGGVAADVAVMFLTILPVAA